MLAVIPTDWPSTYDLFDWNKGEAANQENQTNGKPVRVESDQSQSGNARVKGTEKKGVQW